MNVQRKSDNGAIRPKEDIHTPPFPRLRGTPPKKRQKNTRVRDEEGYSETVCTAHRQSTHEPRAAMAMNTIPT